MMDQSSVARFGKILAFNKKNDTLKIDFEGNPLNQPVWGKIGRLFHTEEINLAIDNQLACRIEFISNDLTLPILTDIYFSIFEEKELRIKAGSIVLEGEENLTLKSGTTSTVYHSKNGHVTTSASHINSEAERTHKIKGKTICLN